MSFSCPYSTDVTHTHCSLVACILLEYSESVAVLIANV